MTSQDIFDVGILVMGAFMLILVLLVRKEMNDKFYELREEWQEHKQVREKLYQELTSTEKIEADFEKSARAREMRDAQRHALPREGAWPPAVVHRPKMRGAKPGNWRLQRGK